ncbi:hypothetical protein ACTS95_10005 [Empedobacter brevis]
MAKKLLNISNSLKKRREFIKNSNNLEAELEFNIMSGFYIIRKLIEHKKLTNKFVSTKIKGNKYQFISGKKITPFNDHKWPEFYDMSSKQNGKFDIAFLCNQFIHSFYFIPSEAFVDEKINENLEKIIDEEYYELCKKCKRKYDGVLFNSDDKKLEHLYELGIDKIISIFEEVSHMDITKSSIIYNKKLNRYDYFQSNEKIETITMDEQRKTAYNKV